MGRNFHFEIQLDGLKDPRGSVNLDDCEKYSRRLTEILDTFIIERDQASIESDSNESEAASKRKFTPTSGSRGSFEDFPGLEEQLEDVDLSGSEGKRPLHSEDEAVEATEDEADGTTFEMPVDNQPEGSADSPAEKKETGLIFEALALTSAPSLLEDTLEERPESDAEESYNNDVKEKGINEEINSYKPPMADPGIPDDLKTDNYTLEVSSAGVERVLRLPGDLDRFAGLPLKVRYSNEGHTLTELAIFCGRKSGDVDEASLQREASLIFEEFIPGKRRKEIKRMKRNRKNKEKEAVSEKASGQKARRLEIEIKDLKDVSLFLDF